MDSVDFVSAHGGIASGRDLLAAGVRRRELTEAVATGRLRRPRLGWYSALRPSHPAFRAVRVGGRLTSVSALAELGAWMLADPYQVEVSVPRGSARLRPDLGVVLHWAEDDEPPESAASVSVRSALERVILDHDLEVSVPCIDWAFATDRLDEPTWRRLLAGLPGSARCISRWVDPASESVLESVARVRLLRAGMPIRSQVPVGLKQSVDLVIADCVALELDGREHHEMSFEKDRRKDLRITVEGRHSIRVTYSMLLGDWAGIMDAIDAALRARGLSLAQVSVTPPPEPRGRRRKIERREQSD